MVKWFQIRNNKSNSAKIIVCYNDPQNNLTILTLPIKAYIADEVLEP